MTDSPQPAAPEDSNALIPATQAPAFESGTALDLHGHDPADYHWVPVLRKRRADGWSPGRQRDFIAMLADTGSVAEAARAADMSPGSAYRLRRSPGAENFAAAWDAALSQASLRLADVAFERALCGVEDEQKFDQYGDPLPRRVRFNDRLLMFLLRAHMPERYAQAHRDVRPADAAPPPATAPLAEAIARLEPAEPQEPHLLTQSDDPVSAMQCADILEGKFPRWHRDPPGDFDPGPWPLGIEFERQLAAARRQAAGRSLV